MTIFRATVTGLLLGQTHQNVLYFQKDGAASNDDANLASDLSAGWVQLWKPALPTGNFVFTEVRIQIMPDSPQQPIVLPMTVTGTGTANGSIMPFVAFKMLKQTAWAGRRGRGRMLIGTPNTGNITGGVLTAATFSFLNNICNQCMARYGPSGTSGFHFGLWGEDQPTQFRDILGFFPASTLATVRRRQLGVGS